MINAPRECNTKTNKKSVTIRGSIVCTEITPQASCDKRESFFFLVSRVLIANLFLLDVLPNRTLVAYLKEHVLKYVSYTHKT